MRGRSTYGDAIDDGGPAAQQRKRAGKRGFASAFEPWLYLSPAMVLLMLVLVVPLIFGISYSFRKFSAFKSEYVGLAQYQALLHDPRSRAGA